jgi:hypothetical protein
VPDFGLSDEEPVFGCEVAKENGPAQCTALEVAALKTAKVTAAPVYQLPWTIQAGQQLGAELGGNISSVVLSGIFAGNYQSVADIKSAMGITPLAGDDTEGLKICRRTNTSGTQAVIPTSGWAATTAAPAQIASFVDGPRRQQRRQRLAGELRRGGERFLEQRGICVIAAATRPRRHQLPRERPEARRCQSEYQWHHAEPADCSPRCVSLVRGVHPELQQRHHQQRGGTERLRQRRPDRPGDHHPAEPVPDAVPQQRPQPGEDRGLGTERHNALPLFAVPTNPFVAATPVGWTT